MDDKLPWFPFYVLDFAGDPTVAAMTTEEIGAYMLLLCTAWLERPAGSIPDDDRLLARMARLSFDRWTECRTAVLAAFRFGKDGRWHQKRMRREWEKQTASRSKRHDAAKIAAQVRWDTEYISDGNNTTYESHALRMRSVCQSETEKDERKTPARGRPAGTPGDENLDGEIRDYIGAHPMLDWDPKAHAGMRKLVLSCGWGRARELVEISLKAKPEFPIHYALGIAAKQVRRDAENGTATKRRQPQNRKYAT